MRGANDGTRTSSVRSINVEDGGGRRECCYGATEEVNTKAFLLSVDAGYITASASKVDGRITL
jgi:hypothetical protein